MWGIPKPQRLVNGVSEWWRYLEPKQAAGYVCALAGIGLTVATALVNGPSLGVIAVLAVVAQGIAAFLFAGHGRAHPTHAKSAFARLLVLAKRVSAAEKTAQGNFEAKGISSGERQTQMGILSAQLSWIGEGIYLAAADWIAFNEPLNEMITEEQRQAIMIAAQEAKKAAQIQSDSTIESDEEFSVPLEAGDNSNDRT
ncbi:hypothetical protein [Mycobacterium deserti]|uniref:Uncharacterized protein n=1 Tax=Mycobacterium deserti TaxID=2978347 RepID=A0ABT2M3H7_9MYCO|nr:hypothetical protein [Mycobacterium deserti]MCT7656827.1 hypothetical protein [Mycobacterium deserti]